MRTKNEQAREGQLIHGPVVKFLSSPTGTPSRIVSGIHCLTENTDCCFGQPGFSVVYYYYSTCFVTFMLASLRQSVILNFFEHFEIIQLTYGFLLFIDPEGSLLYKTLPFCPVTNTFKALYTIESHFPETHINISASFIPKFPRRIQDKILHAFLIPPTHAVYPIYFSCIMALNYVVWRGPIMKIAYVLSPASLLDPNMPLVLHSPVQAMSFLKARGPFALTGSPRPCIQMRDHS